MRKLPHKTLPGRRWVQRPPPRSPAQILDSRSANWCSTYFWSSRWGHNVASLYLLGLGGPFVTTSTASGSLSRISCSLWLEQRWDIWKPTWAWSSSCQILSGVWPSSWSGGAETDIGSPCVLRLGVPISCSGTAHYSLTLTMRMYSSSCFSSKAFSLGNLPSWSAVI